jgi:predicted ATPase
VPPEEIGVSGEYAAQLLHARREEIIHYLSPLGVDHERLEMPSLVRARPLVEALNDVMESLGVAARLRLEDVKDVGFRLLFGEASLQHVGRGLSYLLPVIELGLITDPLRFKSPTADVSLEEYGRACSRVAHCALEEPEAHLHPKVQSRLAHWLVALALCQRQLIVESHSDHLVRRLRGLAARATLGSDMERWLLKNIRLLHVEQANGESVLTPMELTAEGGLESWPADFMDEATNEERMIYDVSLDKTDEVSVTDRVDVEHDVGDEPDVEP